MNEWANCLRASTVDEVASPLPTPPRPRRLWRRLRRCWRRYRYRFQRNVREPALPRPPPRPGAPAPRGTLAVGPRTLGCVGCTARSARAATRPRPASTTTHAPSNSELSEISQGYVLERLFNYQGTGYQYGSKSNLLPNFVTMLSTENNSHKAWQDN